MVCVMIVVWGILWQLLGWVSDMIDYDGKGRMYRLGIDVVGCIFLRHQSCVWAFRDVHVLGTGYGC